MAYEGNCSIITTFKHISLLVYHHQYRFLPLFRCTSFFSSSLDYFSCYVIVPWDFVVFSLFMALITSSSNISSSLSSPIGVISFNSAITSSAELSSNCSLYSSLQYVVHLCTMSSLFTSVVPSSFLIAVSFGFHPLLTLRFLISLYISLVFPSPW